MEMEGGTRDWCMRQLLINTPPVAIFDGFEVSSKPVAIHPWNRAGGIRTGLAGDQLRIAAENSTNAPGCAAQPETPAREVSHKLSENGGEGGIRTLVARYGLNRFRVEIINQQLSFNQQVAPFSPFGSYSGIPPVTDVLCSGLLQFLYAAALRSLRGQCTWMYKCRGRQDAGSSSQ